VSVEGGEGSSARVFVGSDVTIVAKPNSGYQFKYWTAKGDKKEIKDSEYIFTAKSNVTYTAYFEKAAGLDEVNLDAAGGAQKILIDGVLYILRDGRIYTPAGRLVR
jgi:hypothetical protein